MTSSSKRWAASAGAVGLVGGLALGTTSLAGAVSPSPAPPSTRTAPAPNHVLPRGLQMLRGQHRGAGGLVSAITSSSLTLRTPSGTKTIGLTSSTAFYEGATKATRSAVKPGDVVRVLLADPRGIFERRGFRTVLADPRASSPVASSIIVLPAHLSGWVTRVDGSTITITDLDGFTRTVVTSAGTTVKKDGSDATLAAITVGSFLHAVGTVDSNGTTLDATRIGLGLPPRPGLGGRGPGGGPGFGGPGGLPPGADPSADDGAPAPDGSGDPTA